MIFSLIFLFFVPSISGFTCSENATLCEACKLLGANGVNGIKTFYTAGQCSIYTKYGEEGTMWTEAEMCEVLFNSYHPTSCQMAVISDVDLLGYYIQYGIRAIEHSMLLSLHRDNCSATWNWWSRLENATTTAGLGDEDEDCDVVQGAFVDFTLVRLNPANFTPTGVLCQCGEKVPFLPTIKAGFSPQISGAIFFFFCQKYRAIFYT